MDSSPLSRLPDELLEAIVFFLPPAATLAFGSASKRTNKIANEHLVWRRHCVQEWQYWEARHNLPDKLERPPAQTRWRQLYNERKTADKKALDTFDEMLKTQQHRISRFEEISKQGYDMKDMLMKVRDETPDDAEDVLARRYFAEAIIGQIHRITALEMWTRLRERKMVRLEEILGSYDLFILSGNRRGDLSDIETEFDRIAKAIRASDADFDHLSIREKAVKIVQYLRSHGLVGNPNEQEYHALRNNFISMALFDEVHSSLPLQSVAIYCAVARRLGVNAKPSNYPAHVHAVIEAPADVTLNGRPKSPDQNAEAEFMHMDPWRSSEEVPREHLTLRLAQMGAPPVQHAAHLGPTSNYEMAIRTARNIMNSVQESREQQRGSQHQPPYPDIEAAWYAMLWAMFVLGDSHQAATLHRRRQCLPYLADHYQSHFPEDLGLVESHILPMFDTERELMVLMHAITTNRTADRNARAPCRRLGGMQKVDFKIGQYFQHKRYGYEGIIVGWDARCSADPRWISQMRVDDLPRGREQPFYNVIAEDKSSRYVAEENIERLYSRPCVALMQLAGRYFKRWDSHKRAFVSNIQDEYPDD